MTSASFDDVRYALRQFRNAPGFTATAILTLALGIGATTAIFTLVHAVLLKSLPVADPGGLVRIGNVENCCVNGGFETNWSLFSYDLYKHFRDHTPGLTDLAAFQSYAGQIGVRRTGSHHPAEAFNSEFVSGNAFRTLGIAAYAGRMLTPADDRKGATPAAVMSFRTWQQKYGQDASVIGSAFTINGQPFTVVGIAPPGFFGERLTDDPPSFWLPLSDEPMVTGTNSVLDHPELSWLNLIGRVAPGADRRQIEAGMQVELRQWLMDHIDRIEPSAKPAIPKQTLHLAPGGGGVHQMADDYKAGLYLLMAISGFVLLIACANLANLMLVRSTTRKQQISVRTALGASRSRLVRQALTESLTLSVLGGAAGLAVAYAGTRLILRLAFPTTYVPIDASPSLPVLAFAFAAAMLTGVLFGVAPAWMSTHADPIDALRGASRSMGQRGNLTQKSLVVLQAAVALVLLCAAGLLAQSLRNLHNQDFGFKADHRYILHIDPQMAGYQLDQLEAFYRQLHDSIAGIPGVAGVSSSGMSPMDGNSWNTAIYIAGQPSPPLNSNHQSGLDKVSANYFQTVGTRLLSGRPITEQDTSTSRPVAVINQEFARKYFKRQNPIGRHVGLEQKFAGTYEIVGVTEDTKYWGPSAPVRPMLFTAGPQHISYTEPTFRSFEDRGMYMTAVEIHTNGYVPNLEPQVRRALAQVNPNLTVIDFHTFAEQVKSQFDQQTMIATLTSLFGLLALVLASIGLYGVTAYSVERRTNEIGLRMALGADRMNVLRLVLRGAFTQVAIGLAVGIPAAVFAGHAMATQLFGIKPYDPAILFVTTAVLSAAAFLAAVLPARRAASVEPMQALRME